MASDDGDSIEMNVQRPDKKEHRSLFAQSSVEVSPSPPRRASVRPERSRDRSGDRALRSPQRSPSQSRRKPTWGSGGGDGCAVAIPARSKNARPQYERSSGSGKRNSQQHSPSMSREREQQPTSRQKRSPERSPSNRRSKKRKVCSVCDDMILPGQKLYRGISSQHEQCGLDLRSRQQLWRSSPQVKLLISHYVFIFNY